MSGEAGPTTTPRLCPDCLAKVGPEDRFCGACGLALDDIRALIQRRRERSGHAGRMADAHRWMRLKAAIVLWVGLLLATLALGLVMQALDSTHPAIELPFLAFDSLWILAFCSYDRGVLLGLLRWPRPFPAAAMVIAAGVGFAGMQGYFEVLERLGLDMLSYLEDYEVAGWPLWTAFATVVVWPAVFEELAFRGFLQARLGEVMRARDAWIVQAGMFSVLHLLPASSEYFFMGLVLGWMRDRSPPAGHGAPRPVERLGPVRGALALSGPRPGSRARHSPDRGSRAPAQRPRILRLRALPSTRTMAQPLACARPVPARCMSIPDDSAGKRLRCPSCQSMLRITGGDEGLALELVEAAPAPTAKEAPEATAPRWSPRRRGPARRAGSAGPVARAAARCGRRAGRTAGEEDPKGLLGTPVPAPGRDPAVRDRVLGGAREAELPREAARRQGLRAGDRHHQARRRQPLAWARSASHARTTSCSPRSPTSGWGS
ncbi:MAG: lysostaphin resistance A-like protein [Planctomycetota bacterium]